MTFFLTIAKLDQNRENNFDFIRFVAAAMVIFSHTYAVLKDNSSEPLSGATGFITFGSLAVEIFFIVSGYLVCKSLLMRSSPLAANGATAFASSARTVSTPGVSQLH